MLNETRNVTNATYSSLPIDHRVKISLGILYAAACIYTVLANFLVLHFKKKQESRNRNEPQRAFSRNITSIFIRSLAWSDILCGLITFPVVILTFFVDVLRYDWICKSVRYLNFIFPVITSMNLFVIGMERYIGIFHPFIAPSKGTTKRLVFGTWVMGILVSFFPAVVLFSSNKQYVRPNTYTILCVLNSNVPSLRVMAIIYASIQYVIPSIILTITNIKILRFLRRRRKQTGEKDRVGPKKSTASNTFVILIFSFILPYLICALNAAMKGLFKPKLSYTMDYAMRHICGFLAYTNSAVSPTIMICTMPDLNRMTREFFDRQIFRRKRSVCDNSIQPTVVKPKDLELGLKEKAKSSNQQEANVAVSRSHPLTLEFCNNEPLNELSTKF